jgi:hypothetical protein
VWSRSYGAETDGHVSGSAVKEIKKDVDAKDIPIPVVSDGKLSALAEDAVVPKRAV